jgi:hypothetical protein
MNWLLNVKFNIFLIVAGYLVALLYFYKWLQHGGRTNLYVGISLCLWGVWCALGLYAREGAKFDAREDNKEKE